MIAAWVYVKYKCSHPDEKLSDFYLIESHGMDHLTAMKVGIALEEITANMSVINAKPVDFDVRILDISGEIILALRDNGKEFNTIEYQPSSEEKADYRSDRVIVLRVLANDIKYDRVLSLKQTLITIK